MPSPGLGDMGTKNVTIPVGRGRPNGMQKYPQNQWKMKKYTHVSSVPGGLECSCVLHQDRSSSGYKGFLFGLGVARAQACAWHRVGA